MQAHTAGQFRLPGSADASNRRGSTLLIVITLMSMMMLLGFLFYAFAAQERVSAEIYRDAELRETPRPDRNYFDWGLEQLIVGPPQTKKKQYQRVPYNSALWGQRHSLVGNMLGRDNKPFDGEGLRVIPATTTTANGVNTGVLASRVAHTASRRAFAPPRT